MNTREDQKKLVPYLLEKTLKQKLKWREDAGDNSYSTTISGKFVVKVRKNTMEDRIVSVLNERGAELFAFEEDADAPVGDIWNLFDAAKNSALGVDQALVELLSDLENL